MSGSSAPSAALAEVLLPVPVHRVAREQVALRVERVRRRVLVARRDRVEEQLAGDRDAVVAAAARADRRERAAGAVAADADLPLVERRAPRRSRITHFVAVHAVVERRRVRMLGREPVVDRDHDAAGALRERARERVVDLDAAGHEAAAVEVDERRALLVGLDRPVDPHRHAVGVRVLDRVHLVDRAERASRSSRPGSPAPAPASTPRPAAGPRPPRRRAPS